MKLAQAFHLSKREIKEIYNADAKFTQAIRSTLLGLDLNDPEVLKQVADNLILKPQKQVAKIQSDLRVKQRETVQHILKCCSCILNLAEKKTFPLSTAYFAEYSWGHVLYVRMKNPRFWQDLIESPSAVSSRSKELEDALWLLGQFEQGLKFYFNEAGSFTCYYSKDHYRTENNKVYTSSATVMTLYHVILHGMQLIVEYQKQRDKAETALKPIKESQTQIYKLIRQITTTEVIKDAIEFFNLENDKILGTDVEILNISNYISSSMEILKEIEDGMKALTAASEELTTLPSRVV